MKLRFNVILQKDFNQLLSIFKTYQHEYEIEASGTVTLQDGFKVEKGATFAVYPSSF